MTSNRFEMLRKIQGARDVAREVADQAGDEQTAKLATAVESLATQMLSLLPGTEGDGE